MSGTISVAITSEPATDASRRSARVVCSTLARWRSVSETFRYQRRNACGNDRLTSISESDRVVVTVAAMPVPDGPSTSA